jgi:hypothetical protein
METARQNGAAGVAGSAAAGPLLPHPQGLRGAGVPRVGADGPPVREPRRARHTAEGGCLGGRADRGGAYIHAVAGRRLASGAAVSHSVRVWRAAAGAAGACLLLAAIPGLRLQLRSRPAEARRRSWPPAGRDQQQHRGRRTAAAAADDDEDAAPGGGGTAPTPLSA